MQWLFHCYINLKIAFIQKWILNHWHYILRCSFFPTGQTNEEATASSCLNIATGLTGQSHKTIPVAKLQTVLRSSKLVCQLLKSMSMSLILYMTKTAAIWNVRIFCASPKTHIFTVVSHMFMTYSIKFLQWYGRTVSRGHRVNRFRANTRMRVSACLKSLNVNVLLSNVAFCNFCCCMSLLN